MEKLKQYIKNNIVFDYHNDATGEDFSDALWEALDRMSIYAWQNREFFNIDPEAVLHLSVMEFFIIDQSTTIDDISREAQQNLAFNYMYSELKEEYLKAYDDGSEEAEQ